MKVEVAVLGSPSLTVLVVSVDVKQHRTCKGAELRSCVEVEVAVLGPYGLCGRKPTLNWTCRREAEVKCSRQRCREGGQDTH